LDAHCDEAEGRELPRWESVVGLDRELSIMIARGFHGAVGGRSEPRRIATACEFVVGGTFEVGSRPIRLAPDRECGASMNWSRFFGLAAIGLLLLPAASLAAPEEHGKETCPHPEGWEPTEEELQRSLSDHKQWLKEWLKEWEPASGPPSEEAMRASGRMNLCNARLRSLKLNEADLRGAKLNKANLRGAELNNADLSSAELNNANLRGAKLNNANLFGAQLNNADLSEAELNKATLLYAHLNNADLNMAKLNHANPNANLGLLVPAELNNAAYPGPAKLNNANLRLAELNDANLSYAELNNADLLGAKLNNANLRGAQLNNAKLLGAKLNNADLGFAKLNNADLLGAKLNEANLTGAEIADAQLSYADLTGALYAPRSQPPNASISGIIGLKSVLFPKGEEVGLVQLRELLQKAGLRDSEREATFAIETGKTAHALVDWRKNLAGAVEGIFRKAAFEWTTGYGLYPRRAIEISAALWAGMILVYFWPIRLKQRSAQGTGIYQVWPSGRIKTSEREPCLSQSDDVNLLQSSNALGAIGYAAYFSLLSTFNIGWRDLNVGTWIARTQPREYALRATGWLRVVSGIQSLLSVYLLAIWVLTYFGRPFQ
jgi:uncharacterized protein YjbI with pentapeptide repeats